jgi:Tol biopolymer transport system component
MHKLRLVSLVLLVAFQTSACAPAAAPTPTITPPPAKAPAVSVSPPATSTIAPTSTLTPTPAPTSTPSDTPTPTITFTPSATPLGGGSGQIAYHDYLTNENFGISNKYWWDRSMINTIDVASGLTRTLASSDSWSLGLGARYHWSADGWFLYYLRAGYLCRVDLRDKSLSPDCLWDGMEYFFELDPSGTKVLYRSSDDQRCYVRDVVTRDRLRTRNESWLYECGQWSPDGRQIVYTFETNRQTSSKQAVFLMSPGERDQAQLTQPHSLGPQWSPDGQWIAFRKWVGGAPELFLISPDGQTEKQLTRLNSKIYEHYWSPDSQKIAFLHPFAYQMCRGTIGVVDIATRNWQTIFTNNVCNGISWSPDSTHLAYCADPDRDDRYGIYIASLDKQKPTLLLDGLTAYCAPVIWRP